MLSELKLKKVRPIIRWAGSKRAILGVLREFSPVQFSRYMEPFCGSACLFYALSPTRAVLSDINEELINALCYVRWRPVQTHSRLASIVADAETYQHFRELDPEFLSKSDRAIRFLFLNRHCFNGVYRTNRHGKFNVPMGTKTGSLPSAEDYRLVAKLLRRSDLRCQTYQSAILSAKRGDFFYLDPPYAKSHGRDRGEYGVSKFTSADLPEFSAALRELDRIGAKFLLSYDHDAAIEFGLSEGWDAHSLSVQRSVGGFSRKRSQAREVLIYNYPQGKGGRRG